MQAFLNLFPEPRSDNIELFLFCHGEKLKYRVLLPDGQYLYLSPEVKFWLRKYNSVLTSFTRALFKEGDDADLIDFSTSEYSALDIIFFFYLITHPQDTYILKEKDFACEVIMLVHLYAPSLTENIFSAVESDVETILKTSDVDAVKIFWKLVLLSEIIGIKSYWLRPQIHAALTFFPHSIYEMDTSLNIENLLYNLDEDWRKKSLEYLNDDAPQNNYITPSLQEIINHWKEGNEGKLHHIEYRPDIEALMEKNDDGIALLRIPVVARQMGLELNEQEAIDCGKYVLIEYRHQNRSNFPPKIKYTKNGNVININHYTKLDHHILITGIENYKKSKAETINNE